MNAKQATIAFLVFIIMGFLAANLVKPVVTQVVDEIWP
jgi:hypothetical protein